MISVAKARTVTKIEHFPSPPSRPKARPLNDGGRDLPLGRVRVLAERVGRDGGLDAVVLDTRRRGLVDVNRLGEQLRELQCGDSWLPTRKFGRCRLELNPGEGLHEAGWAGPRREGGSRRGTRRRATKTPGRRRRCRCGLGGVRGGGWSVSDGHCGPRCYTRVSLYACDGLPRRRAGRRCAVHGRSRVKTRSVCYILVQSTV